MKNKIKIALLIVICICTFSVLFNNVYADFWSDATKWFSSARSNSNFDPASNQNIESIIREFSNMISIVGTVAIVIATIVLGIKFMIGSVDSKVDAKDGLITLFVACVFFFGWTSIWNLLAPTGELVFVRETKSYSEIIGNIFSFFAFVANIVAILIVIYIGIKYIFAGASGKAELKGKSVYFFIGIILTFATSNVLSFISDIITESLKI